MIPTDDHSCYQLPVIVSKKSRFGGDITQAQIYYIIQQLVEVLLLTWLPGGT